MPVPGHERSPMGDVEATPGPLPGPMCSGPATNALLRDQWTALQQGATPLRPRRLRAAATCSRDDGHDETLDDRCGTQNHSLPETGIDEIEGELSRQDGTSEVHQDHDAITVVCCLERRNDRSGIRAQRVLVEPAATSMRTPPVGTISLANATAASARTRLCETTTIPVMWRSAQGPRGYDDKHRHRCGTGVRVADAALAEI